MNILAWTILGLIAGTIAKALYPGRKGGILGTMLLGIVGASVGGSLYNLLTTGLLALAGASLSLGSIVVAVLGALLALVIYYA